MVSNFIGLRGGRIDIGGKSLGLIPVPSVINLSISCWQDLPWHRPIPALVIRFTESKLSDPSLIASLISFSVTSIQRQMIISPVCFFPFKKFTLLYLYSRLFPELFVHTSLAQLSKQLLFGQIVPSPVLSRFFP